MRVRGNQASQGGARGGGGRVPRSEGDEGGPCFPTRSLSVDGDVFFTRATNAKHGEDLNK